MIAHYMDEIYVRKSQMKKGKEVISSDCDLKLREVKGRLVQAEKENKTLKNDNQQVKDRYKKQLRTCQNLEYKVKLERNKHKKLKEYIEFN